MLTLMDFDSGGLVHVMAVRPLKTQLRLIVDEHNASQTHHSNSSAENEQLRQVSFIYKRRFFGRK